MMRQRERADLASICVSEKMVVLPLCPPPGRIFESVVYRHFMQNFCRLSAVAEEIRVLSSIQAVSAAMGISPALAAKTLVDIGLRAPRHGFPLSFLAWGGNASAESLQSSL
ncbi:MAG: hypothetical protein KGL10_00525 [Alphaproteobacteria bacterium]|nr:hypothetical protein [Alphaproteobacteria bacterium]MDE2335777.1 hypothetical protein [Alphaproteobacteria bacterium]